MFAVDLAFAFIVALVFTVILVAIMGWRRPGYEATWRTAFFVFLLLFLFAWAGGVWLAPFGPTFYNVYWVPFVIIAVLYALLLLAAAPPRLPGSQTRNVAESAAVQAEREDVAAEAFGLFFWVLAVLLLISIILFYIL